MERKLVDDYWNEVQALQSLCSNCCGPLRYCPCKDYNKNNDSCTEAWKKIVEFFNGDEEAAEYSLEKARKATA